MTRRCLVLVVVVLLLGAAPSRGEDGGALSVVGADGRPVPGARVLRLAPTPEGRPVVDASVEAVATSDGGGRVAPWPPAEAETVRFVVVADGHAAAPLPAGGRSTPGVRLAPSRPLVGRIRLGRGVPAKDVEVLAWPEEGDTPGHRARTTDDGSYRFPHLPAGRWVVSIRRKDGRLQSLGTFAAGENAGDTRVVLGTTLTGRVLDARASGEAAAVAGQTIRLLRLPRVRGKAGEELVGQTGGDGRFRLEAVPPGVYEAWIGVPWVFSGDPPRLEVGFERAMDLPSWFALRMRAVATQSLDLDGKPLAGARVTLLADPVRPPLRDAEKNKTFEESDADGRIVLRPVLPAEGYRLIVAREGYSPYVTQPFDVTPVADVTLPSFRMRPGWRLEVLAKDGAGRPLRDVQVTATPVQHPGAADDPAWSAYLRRGKTDENGALVLVDLAEGDHRVVATAEGHLDVAETLQSPRSGNARGWRPALFALPGLRGRVERPSGAVATSVRIVAQPRDGVGRRETVSGAGGAFAFDHLRPVVTDLEAFGPAAVTGGPDVLLARIEAVLPGETDEVVIALPPLRRVAGRVSGILPNGPPASVVLEGPRYDLELERHRWTTLFSRPLERGPALVAFVLEGLAPGTYGIRAVQGARDSEVLTFRVESEDVEDLELDIPAGARVAGTVLGERDLPVLGAQVTLTRLRGDGDAPDLPTGNVFRVTDDAGGYVAEDLAAGLWRVEARDADATPDVEVLRVTEGESLVVRDLVLGRGGTLEGRVEDGLGRPVDGASVAVRSFEIPGDVRRLRSGADGSFRDASLRPGTYLVRLEGIGGTISRVESLAEVVQGQTTTVILAADGKGTIEGTVRRRGKPVAGVTVELLHEPAILGAPPRRFWTETDEGGHFAWTALPEGSYAVGLLDAAARTESAIQLREGDREMLDLEVFDGRLVGRVVTVGGEPVSGAEVRAGAAVDPSPAVSAKGLTGPDGRFVMAGLPIGAYDLRIVAPGLPPAIHRGAEADTQGSEEPVEIVLGRGATVDLTVVDPGRRGVRGARVIVESEDGIPLHVRAWTTGPGGTLRVEGIPAGAVRLRVHARGFGRPAPTPLDLPDGEVAPLTVALRPAGALRLTVTGRGRDPVPRVRVDLVRAATDEVVESRRPLTRVVSNVDLLPVPGSGVVLIEDLEEDNYVAVVSAAEYGTVRIPVRVRARQVQDLAVVLGPP